MKLYLCPCGEYTIACGLLCVKCFNLSIGNGQLTFRG